MVTARSFGARDDCKGGRRKHDERMFRRRGSDQVSLERTAT